MRQMLLPRVVVGAWRPWKEVSAAVFSDRYIYEKEARQTATSGDERLRMIVLTF